MTFTPKALTSGNDIWGTPQDFFDMLNAEFGFTLDPCATHENAKCENYYTAEDDGLHQSWEGAVFVNPPFSQLSHKPWAHKCWESAQKGATVVLLIPVRSDTRYWHNWVMRASELRFVRGRVRFVREDGQSGGTPPFPCVVAVFRPGCDGPPAVSTMGQKQERAIQLALAVEELA